jgi:hypothetical protein
VPELPYMQWFTNDWMGDPKVSRCSPATRGIWFDFLNVMHQEGRTGRLVGTREELARAGRCTPEQLDDALTEIKAKGIGDVTLRHSLVTVTNRRMEREHKKRVSDAKRQRSHRERLASQSPSQTPSQPDNATSYRYGDGDRLLQEGGVGEASPLSPDDLAEIGDWLTRVPKVTISQGLEAVVMQRGYTLPDLKTLWAKVTNTPKIGNRKGFFVSQIKEGAK